MKFLLRFLALYLALSAINVQANNAPQIDLAWSLKQVLLKNPQLLSFPYHLRLVEAEQIQAGLTANPNLELSVENFNGSGRFKSTKNSETKLLLSQLLELGGKRQARLDYAGRHLAEQQNAYEIARLEVFAETARRYYRVLYVQQLLNWIRTREHAEKQALLALQIKSEAGAVSPSELTNMELHLARSQVHLAKLQDQHLLAKQQLAALWLSEANFKRVAGDFSLAIKQSSKAKILESLAKSPRVNALNLAAELAQAKQRLTQVNARADLSLGVGISNFSDTDDQALSLTLSMPLNIRNPQKGNLLAAQAEQKLKLEQQRWFSQELSLEVTRSWLNIKLLQQQLVRLKNKLLPKADNHLREVNIAYQQGQLGTLEWLASQEDYFEIKRHQLDIQQQLTSQFLELESLTGQSISE